MWDPEERKAELERRKEQQQRTKQEGQKKRQLGPMGAGENPPIVSSDSLVSREDSWLFYWTESDEMRRRHGVETVKGLWKIFDRPLFDRTVSSDKVEILKRLKDRWVPKG